MKATTARRRKQDRYELRLNQTRPSGPVPPCIARAQVARERRWWRRNEIAIRSGKELL